MERRISLRPYRAIMAEQAEIPVMMDTHYEMCAALVKARGIIDGVEMDEDEKADLMMTLNDIYRYLGAPLWTQVQDIGGRRN